MGDYYVRRSESRSNGGIKSEAVAEISRDGVVMSDVKPYDGDISVVSSKAQVIQTSESKSIKASVISHRKLLAMATVYPNGDRVVIAREDDDDDDKENQGFTPRMSLQRRSPASNILRERGNQVKPAAVESQAKLLDMVSPRMLLQKRSPTSNILKEQVKAAAVESQAEQLDMVTSRLSSTVGAAYNSWWSPLRAACNWSPFPDANPGAATSQEGLEMAAAPLKTPSLLSSSSSLPGPGVQASHQDQK